MICFVFSRMVSKIYDFWRIYADLGVGFGVEGAA